MARLSFFLPLLLSGCYIAKQAEGQAALLAGLVKVEEKLSDPALPSETRRKLLLVLEVKDFGEREMGLAPTANYTHYFDTEGRPVSYVVSACLRDRFEPYTWWFPIVGRVPYKGFFRRSDALEEARALDAEGYDVSLRPVAAYSTLGWFTDPVLSTMLDDPDEELAALILHELTHATLYVAGDADFNEGLATFVGRQGALEFLRWRYGTGSPEYERGVRAAAEEERRDADARRLFQALEGLYRSSIPPARKVALRDAVGGRRVNNAEILMRRRYGRVDVFQALFDQAGGAWKRFFAGVRSAYGAGFSDPGPLLEEVERRSCLEPLDLLRGERVPQADAVRPAVRMMEDGFHLAPRRQLAKSQEADPVVPPHLVVVGGVREGEGQQPLLLQVRLVDPREAAGNDRRPAQVSR
jgi:predicted aminopeptidase